MRRLLLIDGHSLLHRAFHALPPLTTPDGKPIGAVYGLTRMLLKLFKDLEPTHVGVAMEAKGPTFRHEEFKAYKEQRPEMDKDLEAQIPNAHRLLETLSIPHYIVAGYEGEDVIASIIKKVGEKVDEIIIVTGDRDLFQLIKGKVRVFVPEKGLSEGRMYGAKEVAEKMGIKPEQVVDYKALCGDVSDNIPGVRGIGEKTAKKLLKEYETLGGIYDHSEDLPEKTRKLLGEGKRQADLSRMLATIVSDAPVKPKLKEWSEEVLQSKRAQELFREFGFKSLLKETAKPAEPDDSQLKLI